jgi:hypothetical protein
VTAADALAAALRDRRLGAEVAGDSVRVTVLGLPLTPLVVTRASVPGTGLVWSWRHRGRTWTHACGDPAGAADKIAASLRKPPGAGAAGP